MNLVKVLFTSLKVKVTPLLTKVRRYVSPTYLKSRGLQKVREFFLRMFDVRPRDSKDYYQVGVFLISKRLAFAIFVVIGITSVCVIAFLNPKQTENPPAYRAYSYRSIPLKFVKGRVEILGKSGYRAYLGEVKGGTVTGTGYLYRPDGTKVYEGQFLNNEYHGSGKLYTENESLRYEGEFVRNLFQGEGKLYRMGGIKEYEGSFHNGYMEGMGELYGVGGDALYKGSFYRDRIQYQELLGKKTSEVAQFYMGKRTVFQNENAYCVTMEDLPAIYTCKNGTDTLDAEWEVSGVYVLENVFDTQAKQCQTVKELISYFGTPEYEGNTQVSLEDVVAINRVNQTNDLFGGTIEMKMDAVFEDVIQVKSFDADRLLYIYQFRKEGYRYTFLAEEKNAGFAMYIIEKE